MDDRNESFEETTRVIFRNLPNHCSEKSLKNWILKNCNVRITDVRLPTNSQKKLRRIGFVGVQSSNEALKLIKELDHVFYDTSKVRCSPAFPPGSQNIPRPWSRYAPGSSAYERSQKLKLERKEKRKEKKRRIDTKLDPSKETYDELLLKHEFLTLQKKTYDTQAWNDLLKNNGNQVSKRLKVTTHIKSVTPTKAGMASQRHHVEFEEEEEEEQAKENEAEQQTQYGPRMKEEMESSPVKEITFPVNPSEKSSSLDEDPFEWLRKCSENQKQSEDEIKPFNPESSNTLVKNGQTTSNDLPLTEMREHEKGLYEKDQSTYDDEALIGDTGRLLVLNLPYTVTEDEVLSHFRSFGEISNVHICLDEKKIKSLGRAFVQFAFPADAVKAAAQLHMSLFQGRILRIKGAHLPPNKTFDLKKTFSKHLEGTSSYKEKLKEKLKKNAENPMIWNLLYVSANSALDVVAENISRDKKEIIGLNEIGDDSIAARVALAETNLIHQTKQWIEGEGISASVFEREGISLLASQPIHRDEFVKRSKDTIIAKHLPPQITEEELFKLFSKYGDLVRCTVAPSKTVAVIQFLQTQNAKFAFANLAFTRLRNLPLFLEWAPESIFTSDSSSKSKMLHDHSENNVTIDTIESNAMTTKKLKEVFDTIDHEDFSPVSLFVKNLNFNTTEASLASVFQGVPGFLEATIMRKKMPTKKNCENEVSERQPHSKLSMGYGFLKFDSHDSAVEALKRFQGISLDHHVLELSLSHCNAKESEKKVDKPPVYSGKVTNKLTVRNLAFQATKKDLRRLFQTFGNIIAVRIPKKSDGTSRGYGFIEFISSSEALTALEALQHTHLYGRKLVLEFAKADESNGTGDKSKIQSDTAVDNHEFLFSKKGEAHKYKRILQ